MPETFLRRRLAIAGMFFVNGMLFATWASRIPGMKDQVGLSDARLGVAMLALGVGVVSGLPLTSLVVAHKGSRWMVIAGAMACCAMLPFVGLARSFFVLAPLLWIFGATLGAMDVAMNAQAALLERAGGRSIMASFHGLWSLGGLVGASFGGAFAARGYTPFQHFVTVATALSLIAFGAVRGLIRDAGKASPGSVLAWPSRAVVWIGVVGGCGAVIEGGIADWSGLYLRDALGTGAGFAASGFGAFSLAMMLGRFGGDRLIDRFGRVALLRGGATLTGAALAAALWSGNRHVAVAAFVLAGLGMSTIFPLAFSAAGSLRPTAPGRDIAAVATMAYGGGLVGPPMLGLAASATSLPVALSLLIMPCVVIAALAGLVDNGGRPSGVARMREVAGAGESR